jgi:hypothetical protein
MIVLPAVSFVPGGENGVPLDDEVQEVLARIPIEDQTQLVRLGSGGTDRGHRRQHSHERNQANARQSHTDLLYDEARASGGNWNWAVSAGENVACAL